MGSENRIVALAHAPDTFEDWVAIGRDLSTQRRNVDWMIGDWLAVGQERFADQVEFEFLADQLGIAPKRLKTVASTAAAFPAHLRDETLSIDHHACVASLPAEQRLEVLTRAHAEHLTPEETRIEAVKLRPPTQGAIFVDEDWQHAQLMDLQRAWNRADPSVRTDFMELANEARGGVIDG